MQGSPEFVEGHFAELVEFAEIGCKLPVFVFQIEMVGTVYGSAFRSHKALELKTVVEFAVNALSLMRGRHEPLLPSLLLSNKAIRWVFFGREKSNTLTS